MNMKRHEIYVYKYDDLAFDDIEIDEEILDVPESLRPAPEMQARFLRNCEKLGMLIRVTLH